jgi:glycerophosphoryl diester phosphodiesterase
MSPVKKTIQNFGSPDSPIIIAHRGFSDAAPENTLAAFRKAIEEGVGMIELDVRLSADDQFVVIHDKRLDRTTARRGLVKNLPAKELTALDNGSWFSQNFSKERVSLLQDVFPLVQRGPLLNIEIKPDVESSNGSLAEEMLVEIVKKSRISHRVILTSFNHQMMKRVKHLDQTIVTGILYNPITNFRRPPSQLRAATNADIFICSKYQINGDVVSDARKAGLLVYVYGIKSERDVRRMVRLGIDGLIVNDPKLIKNVLREMKAHPL